MAKVAYEDLSGTSTPVTANPYDGILQACNNDPTQIQTRYHTHRTTRNTQQKLKLLSPDFQGWLLDPVLTKLDGPPGLHDPDFQDPRNCLVFWARPTSKVKHLINIVQQKLKAIVPGIWLMPIDNLHLTAIEVTHSLTAPEIETLASKLLPSSHLIADYPSSSNHSARLIKPMISFDAAALALSFLPASGEASSPNKSRPASADTYTYHHLRRDLHSLITKAGVEIGSRYVVPSAHLTIARFNSPNPFDIDNPLDGTAGINAQKREKLMREIDMINSWLEAEFWPKSGQAGTSAKQEVADDESKASDKTDAIRPGGEWIVGEEKGLDFRKGRLWYGGGETIYLGKSLGHV